jgi:hypothetical protein
MTLTSNLLHVRTIIFIIVSLSLNIEIFKLTKVTTTLQQILPNLNLRILAAAVPASRSIANTISRVSNPVLCGLRNIHDLEDTNETVLGSEGFSEVLREILSSFWWVHRS